MEGSDIDYTECEGESVCCDKCRENQGVVQYFDFCPSCWSELTPHARAVLRGDEPPVKEVIEHTIRTTVYPGPRPVLDTLAVLWRIAVTAALAWVAWKTR